MSGPPAHGGYAQLGYTGPTAGSPQRSTRTGVCSFLVNPTTGTVVGSRWAQAVRATGATAVRAGLNTSARAQCPTHLYAQSLVAYAASGVTVLLAIGREFAATDSPARNAAMRPNMALNATGNLLLSPYIDQWTLRAMAVCRQLRPRRVVLGGEPNTQGSHLPGWLPPDGNDVCLAPEVWATLGYQLALRLASVGVPEVYLGSLSLLPQTGIGLGDGYFCGFVDRGLSWLHRMLGGARLPFAGVTVNSEGIWRPGQFAQAITNLRTVTARYGFPPNVIVTEAGITNNDSRRLEVPATWAELTAVANEVYWFEHPGREPYLGIAQAFPGYGLQSWREAGGEFVPQAQYPLYDTVAPLLRGT